MENIVKITIQNLESTGFAVRYFETADEAAAAILGEVKPGETAGFGGSMTLENMRLRESLESRGIVTFYHGTAKSPAERASILENEARPD
ncbi:MAG: lactate utilization protein, partial [Clostridiales Family XIII bacterium]|nr:lactate utilization protein [Clostridiales Family XIII bacterium]